MTRVCVDFAIVGGGIAGLWSLAVLRRLGFSCVLIEMHALGNGQTLAAQGIIHGGLKYALSTRSRAAATATADMPARWRSLLGGHPAEHAQPDLSGVPIRSEAVHFFAAATAADQLRLLFTRHALNGNVARVSRSDYPEVLADPRFAGQVLRAQDFVLDPRVLLQRLASAHGADLVQAEVTSITGLPMAPQLQLRHGDGCESDVLCQRLLLCAGAGNAALLQLAGRARPTMRLRPLHQLWLRGAALPPAYVHCLSGARNAEPRLTICTHDDAKSRIWSIGGRLATSGIVRDRAAQLTHARRELAHCLPWLDLHEVQFASALIDRAEPATRAGERPDAHMLDYADGVFTCWPSKLSLAPRLGDLLVQAVAEQALHARSDASDDALAHWPRPPLAPPRWGSLQWS